MNGRNFVFKVNHPTALVCPGWACAALTSELLLKEHEASVCGEDTRHRHPRRSAPGWTPTENRQRRQWGRIQNSTASGRAYRSQRGHSHHPVWGSPQVALTDQRKICTPCPCTRRELNKYTQTQIHFAASYVSWFISSCLAFFSLWARAALTITEQQQHNMYLFKTPCYLGKPPLEDECGGRRAPRAITSYQRCTAWHRTSQRNCGIQQSISKNTIWCSLACMGFNNREHAGQLCSCPGQTCPRRLQWDKKHQLQTVGWVERGCLVR